MMRYRHIKPLPQAMALLVLTSFVLTSLALADNDAGTRSVFARGAGGRPLALGGAFVAAEGDPSSMSWNPAGLAGIQRKSMYATHTDLIGFGFSEQFAVVTLPSWRLGTFSLAFRRFAVDGIEGRDDRGTILDTDLKDAETEFALGYGRKLGPAWRVGAAIKMQQQELAGYSDAGLGMDLGIQSKPLLATGFKSTLANALSLGIQFRNIIEPTLKLLNDDLPDPSGLRFGLAVDYPFGENWGALVVTDLEKTKDMDTRLHAGLELQLLDLLALRVGSFDGMLTAGTGIAWRNFQLDYSFEDNPIETVHRMGFGISFGPTVQEQRQAVLDQQEQYLQDRLSTAFAQQNRQRIDDLVRSARAALEIKDTDRVFTLTATIRVLAPDHEALDSMEATAYQILAESQEKAGHLAAATLNFSHCLALDPQNRAASEGMIRVREESNRETARSSEIRELFDDAMAAFTAGDLIQARDMFTRLLKQKPDDPGAAAMLQHAEKMLLIRAQSLAEQSESLAISGRLDPARQALAECRQLDPACPGIAAAERAIAGRTERDRQARANIQAALSEAAATESVPALTTEQSSLIPGKLPPSFDQLSEDRQKEVAELYSKGIQAAQQGRRDNAMRYWELVWSEAPDYQQVSNHLKEEYLARGMEAFANGDLDLAIKYWEQTRVIDPNDPRAKGYLARAQEQLTRMREIRNTQ